MDIKRCTALGATMTALAMPSLAVADKPTSTPKGKAYGKYCQTESKQHVKGEKGTAFSRCVKAAAQAARTAETDADVTPKKAAKRACKGLSKKHVKGTKGTAYSRCIVAAAQANKDAKDDGSTDETAARS